MLRLFLRFLAANLALQTRLSHTLAAPHFQTFASLLYMVTQNKYVTDLKHSSCRHTGEVDSSGRTQAPPFKRLQVFYTWSHRTNTSQYSTHSSCRHTGKVVSSGRTQALPQGSRPPGVGFPGVGSPRGDTIDEKAFRDALT